jgi:hypothetical protein
MATDGLRIGKSMNYHAGSASKPLAIVKRWIVALLISYARGLSEFIFYSFLLARFSLFRVLHASPKLGDYAPEKGPGVVNKFMQSIRRLMRTVALHNWRGFHDIDNTTDLELIFNSSILLRLMFPGNPTPVPN